MMNESKEKLSVRPFVGPRYAQKPGDNGGKAQVSSVTCAVAVTLVELSAGPRDWISVHEP